MVVSYLTTYEDFAIFPVQRHTWKEGLKAHRIWDLLLKIIVVIMSTTLLPDPLLDSRFEYKLHSEMSLASQVHGNVLETAWIPKKA